MSNTQSGGAIDDSEFPKIKVCDGVTVTDIGTPSELPEKTYSIPAGLIGANGTLSYKVEGYTCLDEDYKILQIKLDGNIINQITQAANVNPVSFVMAGTISNKNAENAQQIFNRNIYDGATVICERKADEAVDTSAEVDLDVVLDEQYLNDETHITHFEVRVLPKD